MEGGACEVRDRRLQGIEAVVQRQERVSAEGDDDRFLLDAQHSRAGILGAGPNIGSAVPASPLGNGLLVDAVALRQNPQALLTMLYRSTHCRCRAGAPV